MQPAGEVVDIGRAIVVKDYRSAEHVLFGALLARSWFEIRGRGYQNLCGTATGLRLARYQQFGLPLRILDPSRRYWARIGSRVSRRPGVRGVRETLHRQSVK